MKKFCVVTSLITVFIISVIIFGLSEGYRIIIDGDLKRIDKPKEESYYADDLLDYNIISVSEGGDLKRYTYREAGVVARVTGIETSLCTVDISNRKINLSMPLESVVFTDIENSRTEAEAGKLIIDDGVLSIDGATADNKIKWDELYEYVLGKVGNAEGITIQVEDFYTESEKTEYQKNMEDSIERFNNFKITYSNGFTLDSAVLAKRKAIDILDDGTYDVTLTESTCRDILGKNLTGYNNIGLMRDFKTHDGKSIQVKSETYGNYIDYQAEAEYVLNAIASNTSESGREPIMKQSEEVKLENTYIEIDKAQQKVFYYENNELMLETDVVTGLPTSKRDTPTGIYFIINKVTDTRLKGESWDVAVDRWMAVTYTGVGFHDASWRNKFGGSIYKSNGSHGCINTPKDAMYKLYDMVALGTPVVIY